MAKKKRTTKKIKPSSKNKNPQQIQINLKPNDSTETWNNSNIEATQQPKCLICAKEINSSIAAVPFDEVFTFQILCQLFKILKISPAVCRFLLEDSLSTVKVQFCESCDKTITHCLKVSQEIDNLRNVLEESTIKIKEDIIEGYYCRPDADLSQRTNSNIRKTLVQCWTTCQVKVKRLPPSIFESHPNVKFTKRTKSGLWTVKQEVCDDDNQVDSTEGPSSPSPNEIVESQSQKDVETEGITSDNDFDDEDIQPPCSPIPATLSDESDTENFDDPRKEDVVPEALCSPLPASLFVSDESDAEEIDDPLNKGVVSEAPCSPLPPVLSDGGETERIDDLIKEEPIADANSEKDDSPNIRRSVRNLSAKKKVPSYCIEIESDENASETGSVYSPESPDSPYNDKGQGINQRVPASSLLSCGEKSPKVRRRQTKTQAKGSASRKNKNRSKANLGKSAEIKLKGSTNAHTDKPDEFQYHCQICNRGFVRENHFQNHSKKCRNALGEDGLKFPCYLCPNSNFATLRKLQVHQVGVHKLGKPREPEGRPLQSFLCTYCDKNYRREDFKISAETETETNGGTAGDLLNIQCDLPNCDRKFSNFYQFSVHHSTTCPERRRLIAENPDNHKQKFGCVRTFGNSKPTNETTTCLYKCKACSCKFRNLDRLAVHEKRHSGPGDIPCPTCELKFDNVYLTRFHQIRVHGQPTKSTYDEENELDSFECVWCNQFFLRSNYWVTENNENSNDINGDGPTSSTSPPKQVLRIPIKKTKKSSKGYVTSFKTFLWCHRRYCTMRPTIQILEGVPERRNRVLSKRPRKPPKSKLSLAEENMEPGPEMETEKETRTVYSCDICGKGYIVESSYRAHVLSHRQDLKHSCPECHENFETEVRCSRHYFLNHAPLSKMRSNQVDSYYCFRCEKKMEVTFEINAQGKKLFPCIYSGCRSKSMNVDQHRIHHSKHHLDSNRAGVKYYCSTCKKFYKPDDVRVKTSDDGEDKFECNSDECKTMSKNFRLWRMHHRRHHHLNTGKSFKTVHKFNPEASTCKICKKIFTRPSYCQHHMITAHTKQYPFYCEVCGDGQATISKLREHLLVHSTERPFKCEQCPKTFKSKYQLKIHRNFHNKINPYVCEVCGKAFHRPNNLYMHRKHTHKL